MIRLLALVPLCVAASAQGARYFGDLETQSLELPPRLGPSCGPRPGPTPQPPSIYRNSLPPAFPRTPSWEAWWALHGPRVLAPLPQVSARPAAALSDEDSARSAAAIRQNLGTAPRDLAVASFLALGKIARRNPTQEAPPRELLDALEHEDRAVRHAAILGLGISGCAQAASPLEAVIVKRRDGRVADTMAQALALYGLGLLAAQNKGPAMEQRVVSAADAVLSVVPEEPISVRIGALHALALARPRDPVTLRTALRLIEEAEEDNRLCLQTPLSVAAILGPQHADSDAWRERYVAELQSPVGRRKSPSRQSAVALALGNLCAPVEDKASRDFDAMMTLVGHIRAAKSGPISRASAWVALGNIGGAATRKLLARSLARSTPHDRSWITIGIALAHSRALRNGVDPEDAIEKKAVTALQRLYTSKRPTSARGAYACALGVLARRETSDQLLTALAQRYNRELESEPTALAVALLEGDGTGDVLTELFRKSMRRPTLGHATATALALADRRTANRELLRHLPMATNEGMRSGIALGLGRSADPTTLRALERILADTGVPAANRAAAADALGCALEPGIPWRDLLGPLVHLQASTAALLDGPVPVLRQL